MTSFALKLIAIFSMLLDHTLKILPCQLILYRFFGLPLDASAALIHAISPLGRLAFPIFAFLVAEGCRHTHSPKRYAGRLLLFGLLSELPFRLAFYGSSSWRFLPTSNVFFTLLLGALSCFAYQALREKGHRAVPIRHLSAPGAMPLANSQLGNELPKAARLLAFLPPVLFAVSAEPLHTDYGFFGVMLIFAAYACPKKLPALLSMAGILTVLYLGVASWNGLYFMWFQSPSYGLNWIAALAALILLYFYNGRRGKPMKWFFYLFYPAHLALLYGISLSLTPLLIPFG